MSEITDVWEHHPSEQYRRDISHWAGHGRWTNGEWEAIGRKTIAALRRTGVKLGTGDRYRFLEWGPGGGANAAALSLWADRFIGVDVSMKNLQEAKRQAGDAFVGIRIGDEPRVRFDVVPADVFLSTATFQHFPSHEYAEAVLREMHRLTVPRALGIIQIRLDDGDGKYGAMQRGGNYRRDHIRAWAATPHEFMAMARRAGFTVFDMMDRDFSVSYATFGMSRDA